MTIRLTSAVAISLLPNSRALRGPDELVFLASAQDIRARPLIEILTGSGITPLHQWLFALQQRLISASDLTLRLTQIALAVAGLALLAAVVYDLAGPAAARLAAWLLAFEPTSVFFSGYLHKDPLVTFAVGVVAYGLLLMWRHRSLRALAAISAGCLVATLTRPYIGWILTAASVTLILHAAMRRQHGRRAALLAGVAICFMTVALSVALREAPAKLERLQASQEANFRDTSSNLKYERVDYSTPAAIARNLPTRVSAFLLRPYPWQLQNTNQQLGAIGGVVVLITLVLVAASIPRSRGHIMTRAGPLIYVGGALILAYSVISANAGTAFRLRENVTAVLICIGCSLHAPRDESLEEQAGEDRDTELATSGSRSRLAGGAHHTPVRAPVLR
ncbi:MAG: glycosyltransferase family 39 protein [Chloroflexota bacterium]|nr:glycosyltransferase family 39 protein [Chloroflexota bacterium]